MKKSVQPMKMNIQNKEQWEDSFLEACKKGLLDDVRHFCQKQYLDLGWADIHCHKDWGFQSACYHGHLEVVKYLLTSPELIAEGHTFADLHADNEDGFRRACDGGHVEIVKYLLTSPDLIEAGHSFADLHADNNDNDDGFCRACEQGHLEVVKYLLTSKDLIEAGHTWADAHAFRAQGFHLACADEHWNVVRWLVLDYGIEKTPAIEALFQHYPQAQEYFRAREDLKEIQGVLKNNDPDKMTDPPSEKTELGSFRKAKKL